MTLSIQSTCEYYSSYIHHGETNEIQHISLVSLITLPTKLFRQKSIPSVALHEFEIIHR